MANRTPVHFISPLRASRGSTSLARLALALGMAGAGAGCFYPADRGRALEARLDRVNEESAALESRFAESEARWNQTLPQVDAKVQEVEEALSKLDRASRRSSADIGVQLQKLIEDVAGLRGEVEKAVHTARVLETRLTTLEDGLGKRLAGYTEKEAEAARAAREAREAEEKAREREEKAAAELSKLKIADDPQRLMADARKRRLADEHATARHLYESFLERFPDHVLIGEAHFGIGDTWFREDECRKALLSFRKVIEGHPKTTNAPTAYLRSATCFGKLGMKSASKTALEEVIRLYPRSQAAAHAKRELDGR